MTTRFRISAFGSAAALIIAGVACAALISGGTGQILAMALIGLGLVAATSLVFFEVGLSEDRERARERQLSSPERADRTTRRKRPKLPRSRDHRRRLG